jgi:hypothetical protein
MKPPGLTFSPIIPHSIEREHNIRDYKEQDRRVALLEQPSDPVSITAFRSWRSVLCDMKREKRELTGEYISTGSA